MPLAILGFLCLFLELALIRWMPASMFTLAYFSNTVLLASFLGLGLGYLLAEKRRDLFAWFVPCVMAVLLCSFVFRYVFVFMAPPEGDVLWNFYYVDNWLRPLAVHLGMLPALMCAFVLSAAPFVFIGQKTALLMRGMPSLRAYGLNTLGGFFGIVVFALCSWVGGFWGTPVAWFVVVACAAGLVNPLTRRSLVRAGALVLAVGLLFWGFGRGTHRELWSPYYSIIATSDPSTLDLHIFVNRFLHQIGVNFSLNTYGTERYDLPYTFLNPQRVLVLGAGTGNDVATAVRNGVPVIDAVEIDPIIAELGRQAHASAPYESSAVNLMIDDARSYLRNTSNTYDMIVFGTLDSHALLSGLSTVRVENYVYTLEAFQEARRRLSPNGVVVIMYSAPQDWLAEKIIQTAVEAFPDAPPLLHHNDDHFMYNLMVVAGPGVRSITESGALPAEFLQARPGAFAHAAVPTDDWPYLYLRDRGIPEHYVKAAIILLLISCLGIWSMAGSEVRTWDRWKAAQFFCLGAAFLLLETKSVTTLSLVFGSTWVVNAAVFGSITAMVFFGTVLADRFRSLRIDAAYGLLGLAIALNVVLPPSVFLDASLWVRFTLPAFIAALPLLCAAYIFALHVRGVSNLPFLLGVNLLGVVVGGLLEYLSMIVGLRALYGVAAVLYGVAFLAHWMQRRARLV